MMAAVGLELVIPTFNLIEELLIFHNTRNECIPVWQLKVYVVTEAVEG